MGNASRSLDKIFFGQRPQAKSWPPRLSEDQYNLLISNTKDWQLTHGSTLKLIGTDIENTVQARPVGVTLFPTLYPSELFNLALNLQKTFNKLYIAVAEDERWLYEVLKDLIRVDPLTAALWSVHEEAKRRGSAQDLVLGIFRSDYMLHGKSTKERPVLKQVELNTISCAGGVHGDRISKLHAHLRKIGAYQDVQQDEEDGKAPLTIDYVHPENRTLKVITAGLQEAHHAYNSSQSTKQAQPLQTCILMVVQPMNFNIADERPIEYALWDLDIPTYRIEWGSDILNHTRLNETRELLYQPPTMLQPMLVSVVYLRAGFEAHEYAESMNGFEMRLRLETSKAIKCPSILSHLTTFKKVQQALAVPGILERFLDPSEAKLVADTFANMYPLDDSKAGRRGRELAFSDKHAQNHVLKPSLEGGGHNIYGNNIPPYLKNLPQETWHVHILQEKIVSPAVTNVLMSPVGLYDGPVISELGVFGICLWRRKASGQRQAEIVTEQEPCWSLKTKSADVNEMSVVKGFGCFDSPALVDMDTYLSRLRRS